MTALFPWIMLALAVVFLIWLAQQIWATVRSYRRERQWEELAKKGDPTALIIEQLREKRLR